MTYTYRTDLAFTLCDSNDADEHRLTLELGYKVYPGWEPTFEQPGEGPSACIISATVIAGDCGHHEAPNWLWRAIDGDEELERALLTYAAECDECARDFHNDMKRDERRFG